MHEVELDLLADQPAQQHGEVAQRVAEIEHLRPQGLPAREREQLPHQRGGARRVLLDLHDVLERRVGRLVRVQQEVVRHHDGRQHVVEVVRDAAGELADHVHLLRLVDLVLQRAPLGGLEHVDDRGLGLALVLLHRRDEELAPALPCAFQHHLDRRDVALPFGGLVDRRDQKFAVARIDGAEDRFGAGAVADQPLRQLGVARIGADHAAAAIDGRDRHRRVIEEAHEAHFGGALGIGALVAGAADHQRPRRRRARRRRRRRACDRAAPAWSCRRACADRCRRLRSSPRRAPPRSRSAAPRRRRRRCRSASARPSRSRQGHGRASSPASR